MAAASFRYLTADCSVLGLNRSESCYRQSSVSAMLLYRSLEWRAMAMEGTGAADLGSQRRAQRLSAAHQASGWILSLKLESCQSLNQLCNFSQLRAESGSQECNNKFSFKSPKIQREIRPNEWLLKGGGDALHGAYMQLWWLTSPLSSISLLLSTYWPQYTSH